MDSMKPADGAERSARRYAVIGAGALGGLYGGLLARSGFEVHFLLHSDYEHVRDHGLKVETTLGDFHLPKVHAHATAESMPPCDVTILGLKTTRNGSLPELLPTPTRGGGVVLVLQNGLDVEAATAAIVGPERTLGGCCFLCSNKVGPGHIRHIDYGRVVFGEYDARRQDDLARAESIRRDFSAAGIDAHTTDDLRKTRWRKLMWNIPFNGLSVVLNTSTRELIDDPEASQLAGSIIAEVHAAAARCGASIDEQAIEQTLEHTREMVPYDSSMRLDYLARRPIELEAIFGNPLRAAQERGAEMPRVQMLYRQLAFLDRMNRSVPG